ncbi:uncharacterized protein LOC114760761 [Neltuma alba]|uniref:uncharacterized protein LOC114750686 n=1 Tax=Neltuma alba TaxID=207710 RepID=UPI0010A3F8FA|nr:uncharacterized protein LOC114750686 [Prosopis alba]XP_028805883.1 uncharacterized protein LOC114760761 [Prosopis alba]
MAIEFFSGNSGDPVSPRISFSYDFHSNAIPVEQHLSRSNSWGLNNPSFDFDFCVRESFDQEASSADELFSDGRLLPSEIKKKKKKNFPQKQTDHHQFLLPHQHRSPPPEAVRENVSIMKVSKPERLKEEADVEKQVHNHKSFWRFKRSKSYGTGYGRSLCPLPLLSRSYSTGSTSPSTSSVKKNMSVSKEGKNNNTQKLHASARSSSSSLCHNSYLKPPLKKSQASYGNGVPVILHVPSANLFGFGSIFSKSKDKTKRK